MYFRYKTKHLIQFSEIAVVYSENHTKSKQTAGKTHKLLKLKQVAALYFSGVNLFVAHLPKQLHSRPVTRWHEGCKILVLLPDWSYLSCFPDTETCDANSRVQHGVDIGKDEGKSCRLQT